MSAEMPPSVTRLVVADDTDDVRALLRIVLDRPGFEIVGEAVNGVEAVSMAHQHQPDVVIVDLAMPLMGGIEAIPFIREHAPAAKIVVYSGFAAALKEVEARGAGADAYIEKGGGPGELIAALTSVLAIRREARAGGVVPEDVVSVLHALLHPVTVIEGFATMIETRADRLSPAELHDYAARIHAGAAELRDLIRAVADAREVEDGSLVLNRADEDVARLVAEVVADLDDVTSPHPVLLDLVPHATASVDAGRIRQVMAGLLANAAAFSEPHEPIKVVVARRRGAVEVWVADHGPGIPPERASELFGRFARLGRDGPGLGVGLYIGRGIARAHGGDLVLGPATPGEGARFVLTLPA